ncbi:MAG: GNAT family N-acetyltransferase [Clostridium sp.]|uniref:GNAT family N-acetyltransferase n=1 Tax=Clostridium sp. TaxID=1506 RepID=UPI0030417355
MYRINKIDISNLTESEIRNFQLINNSIVEKYSFLNQFKDIDKYKDLYLSTFTEADKELFTLQNDSLICGILNCIKSSDWSGKEQYKLTIYLCDLIINEVLLECLNEFIQNKLAQHGELAIVTYNNELEEVIGKYTNKVNLKSNYYTLSKEDINIDLLNRSIKEYEEKNMDFSIRYTDIILEEYIEQYCDLFMETMEDMTDVREDGYVQYIITPEKQRQSNDSNKKRNITHNCYMIFNSDNEMIAKSNVSVNNNNPRFPYQFMIGVKKSYRGRGLGKWLYASMYKRLLENVDFEKVFVCHHPENKHAINISKWIGYKFNYLEIIHILF